MPISIESLLLIASVLFFISLFATKASNWFGVPVLLLFLAIGMIFGVDGLGSKFENYKMAQTIGTVALCIILFSGGLDTKFKDIRPVWGPGIVLSTLGVLLTSLFTGIFIYYIVNALAGGDYHISFLESLLLASVMSSTDSASVFSILRGRGVNLKNNLKPLLELESGSNDPMAYMLTLVLIQLITGDAASGHNQYATAVLNFFLQFIIGAGAGFILGKGAVWLINKINLSNDALYPILLFTCGIFVFSATYFIMGNGYLAVYIAGLLIGNSKIVSKRSSIKFFDGLAWLSQIVMFLTLGLFVNPSELIPVALIGLLIGTFMTVGSRPLSVFLSLIPFKKVAVKDKHFVSWVGLKGAVPIIFAIYPLAANIESARFMFNVVFIITLMSLLVQGTSLTAVARWLGISDKETANNRFRDFDVEFSEDFKSTMTEIEITENTSSAGRKLMELPLPDSTLAVMVKRDNEYFIPQGNTVLLSGDKLLVITTNEDDLLEIYNCLGITDYRLKRN
jgi:cell volume regulation protein A